MATALHLPIASSIACTSSSTTSPKRRAFSKTCCAVNARNNVKIPMPPVNPKDPFLSKLASVAANSPEQILNWPSISDTPPYLDIFESPKLMATPAQVERSVSYNEHRPRRPPPDLPSLLLHGRIVYIGMPLVPAVTELVVAELMYLQWMDPKEPIYLYINSTGTTRDDGETVGMETEGFAIYDAMMQLKNEVKFHPSIAESSNFSTRQIRDAFVISVMITITCLVYFVSSLRFPLGFIFLAGSPKTLKTYHLKRYMQIHTVAVGAAIGQACLLLAAGSKGKRFMMPHAKAMIQQPRVPSSGLMPASDVLIRAKEVIINRDTLVNLLAKHTGNSVDAVADVMRRPFYMDSTRAKEFGVIDKILWRGQEKIMADAAAPEDWDKNAGIKALDAV
ncbi:hypothetical protein RJ639_002259 [Escallonia herrerae]|uniref:ATP-dependent Clp protease proteolytic subunit n=1 Tax=Escallonia herrerae TaxID=1293975 RepID=A0AA88X990_9ASTE|nr:hypothetical protein RJ639_002259 [Escallonia herrerae]